MKNRKGFTIVELVIVIAVIAILAAVLIPTFSGVIQRANESASLQTATSAMKTVLAQSSSATISDGTFFCVGSKEGVQYIYKYDNQKMGTENLKGKAEYGVLYGKAVTDAEEKKLNCVIIPVENTTPDKSPETLAILKNILGYEVKENEIIAVPSSGAPETLPEHAAYYINHNFGTEEAPFYIGVLTNVDFTNGTVVFTYSR